MQKSGKQTVANISEMVRALAVVLNTGAVYRITHPVFTQSVEERLPAFTAALKTTREIRLVFTGGQVICDDTTLEPGADMFEKLARSFEAKGVTGLALRNGLTPEELSSFTDIFHNQLGKAEADSGKLKTLLRKAQVRNISEYFPKITTGPTGPGAEGESTTDAGRQETGRASKDASRTFELDLADFSLENAFATEIEQPKTSTKAIREYGRFVDNHLHHFSRETATLEETSTAITLEFEKQLNSRIAEVRRETEVKIRRLENIKDMVFQELEELALAAIVVDSSRHIIAANKSGREIIGQLDYVEIGSPLERFIASGREKEKVIIRNASYNAHLIISETTGEEENAMLICLEK